MKNKRPTIYFFFSILVFIGIFFVPSKSIFAVSDSMINATVKVSICGNNIAENNEQCDGLDLKGASCQSQGYTGGTLSCSASCSFNVSQCTNVPTSFVSSGGRYIATVTGVNFSGRAYPKSTVTVLKDTQIVATTVADNNGNFSVNINVLYSGNYIFNLYSEDSNGNRSSTLTFPVNVAFGRITKITDVFISPTIAIDKSEVKRGDNIKIFGQSAPNEEINISVNNSGKEFLGNTFSDKNGKYIYNLDTSKLDIGHLLVKSEAKNVAINSFSKTQSSLIGTKNIFTQPSVSTKDNINNDNKVKILNLLIPAYYWYEYADHHVSLDLDGDNKFDLVDFSIMLFYWII